jgi:hypothetical protein
MFISMENRRSPKKCIITSLASDSSLGLDLSIYVNKKPDPSGDPVPLKVHKNENFFGFDFEFCTISLLVMSKY